jgi:hypothetical protein
MMNYLFKRHIQLLIRKFITGKDINLLPLSRKFGYERGTPIDRIYIDEHLKKNSKLFKGECLEIGFPEFLLKFKVPKKDITILGINKTRNKFNFLNCDLTNTESLPDRKFDLFVCTQTYNFISNYSLAVQNSARLINRDGTLLGTVSGLSTLSQYDNDRWGDYYRFSSRAIEEVLRNYFNEVEVTSYGNLYSTIHFLAGYSYEDLESKILVMERDDLYPMIIGFKASKPKD